MFKVPIIPHRFLLGFGGTLTDGGPPGVSISGLIVERVASAVSVALVIHGYGVAFAIDPKGQL